MSSKFKIGIATFVKKDEFLTKNFFSIRLKKIKIKSITILPKCNNIMLIHKMYNFFLISLDVSAYRSNKTKHERKICEIHETI